MSNEDKDEFAGKTNSEIIEIVWPEEKPSFWRAFSKHFKNYGVFYYIGFMILMGIAEFTLT